MEQERLKGVAEGLLFAGGDEGITVSELSSILDISLDEVRQIIDELQTDYKSRVVPDDSEC